MYANVHEFDKKPNTYTEVIGQSSLSQWEFIPFMINLQLNQNDFKRLLK